MKIEILDGEYWYGGVIVQGIDMPYSKDTDRVIDLRLGTDPSFRDQIAPYFFSNKGRYIYSKEPCIFTFKNGVIDVDCDIELGDGYENLKGAQLALAKKHFDLSGKIPNKLFMEKPQVNTWIEFMYNQNEKGILEYAKSLVEGGIDGGIFMIDEGWAPDYGDFDFDRRKFEDPRGMVEKLHKMGFRVMLWITPYISPDGYCYRELRNTDYFIKDKNGKLAIRKWWNGYSAVLDLTNPKCVRWFHGKLHGIMEKYGVDGFKFDGGGASCYREDDKIFTPCAKYLQTRAFDKFASKYEFNELREVYDCGGSPLVCRLHDKAATWHKGDEGMSAILPSMLIQGLCGYFYGCPDMVGGGQYTSFLNGKKTNEELYLRWLEMSALCPMMQFSISPKRLLSEENFKNAREISKLHDEYADKIISLAENASKTGEPIMRLMEYEYPNCGYEKVMDQFLLGNDTLVAPVLNEGAIEREVQIPNGKWADKKGNIYDGGKTYTIEAKLEELIILEKVK